MSGPHSWLAAPGGILIGVIIFCISRRFYQKSVWFLLPVAIVTTFIAVALFGLCLGFADLMRDLPGQIAWAVVLQGMNACLWALIFIPLYWALFPLAFGNHLLIRYLTAREAEPAASPNRGPAERIGNSEVGGGPHR
jgi:hypothetical protein